jgi:hypothetical protein
LFFKITYRDNKEDIKLSTHYYRLVESYRDSNDIIRHRTLLNVGNLDHLTKKQFDEIRIELTNRASGKFNLFIPSDEIIKEYIEQFWHRLIKEKRIDIAELKSERGKMIDTSTLEHKEVREIGAEWLGYQACNQLRIKEYLMSVGWNKEKIDLAITQIISRAVYPASELKTSKWIQDNSGICELTSYPTSEITKDKLYKSALDLYQVKEGLEQHLSKRTNELFDIEDKIILYDLTNTYFEGKKTKSEISQYGRSKEKRTDAKIVVLAVVVNEQGFLKYSTIYEGNTADCNTLPDMVKRLTKESHIVDAKPLIVFDAGIATEDNLTILADAGYKYLCVNRTKLTDYIVKENSIEQKVLTNDHQELSLQPVLSDKHTDYFLKVKSPGKTLKELSMKNKFDKLFIEELEKIKNSITKKHGTKKADKVNQRIGRAKEKYPSVSYYYNIETKTDTNQQVTEMTYTLDEVKSKKREENAGVYFLRTNVSFDQDQNIWKAYNTIREVESTFRTLKTELDLRPIYHKNDDATKAHLHLGLLAYWLVNTIRFQLKAKGMNADWREITRIANTQKVVTTAGFGACDEQIVIRKCSEPSTDLKAIYNMLNLTHYPLKKRKSVVHNPQLEKINSLIFNTSPPY